MSANNTLRDQHMVSGTTKNNTCLTNTCLCRPNNAYRHAPIHFSNSHTGACGAPVHFTNSHPALFGHSGHWHSCDTAQGQFLASQGRRLGLRDQEPAAEPTQFLVPGTILLFLEAFFLFPGPCFEPGNNIPDMCFVPGGVICSWKMIRSWGNSLLGTAVLSQGQTASARPA